MRLDHIFPRVNLALLEAKARIEHPEDMILDGGLRGAQTALRILQATALKPQSVSVKFDGSPALIMGWRGDDFVLTDKAGFGAKGYDGMTTSSDAVESMIMARKMKDTSEPAVAARRKYAQTIASLYPILRASVPKSFAGYAQGDLLWVGTPPVVDGAYQFKPNKVLYKVPVDSDLGKRIAGSKVGMVIHSVYPDQSAQEPDALRDVHELGFSEDHGLVIVPHEIELESTLSLDPHVYAQAQKILSAHGAHIDAFLDPLALADRNIKALPGFMKSFLAHKAGEGSNDFSRVGEEFLTWLTSAKSKASGKQQVAITDWIQQNLEGYNDVWHVVKLLVDLKLHLKAQMDQQVGDVVAAQLNDKPGHEGFVSVTPDGIIKLVHRAEFMRKDTSESLMEAQEPAPKVVFTFIRANPPTLGHQLVVDQVARHARGGDYWVFFSQSQDAKKNPLSWHDKVQFASKLMPRHKSHFARGAEFAHVKTPLLAMDWLYNQGYRDITMVVGSDRVDSMNDILNGWNSEAIRSKYGRDPVQVRVISAGERDPDAEGVTGISASMVRELAAQGDKKAFDAAVGLDPTTADALYDAVRKGMKIGEPKGKSKKSSLTEDRPADHKHGTIVMLRMSSASGDKLAEWCKQNNVPCMDPHHMHISVLFSKKPVPHLQRLNNTPIQVTCKPQAWKMLGDKALTLVFDCPAVQKIHQDLKDLGGEHSYPDLIVHTSVNYDWNHQLALPDQLPRMPLVFDRVEVMAIDPDYKPNSN